MALNINKIINKKLEKIGFIDFTPNCCDNRVFKYIENNTDIVFTTILDSGLIRIYSKLLFQVTNN